MVSSCVYYRTCAAHSYSEQGENKNELKEKEKKRLCILCLRQRKIVKALCCSREYVLNPSDLSPQFCSVLNLSEFYKKNQASLRHSGVGAVLHLMKSLMGQAEALSSLLLVGTAWNVQMIISNLPKLFFAFDIGKFLGAHAEL